jgi:hypothetical protein
VQEKHVADVTAFFSAVVGTDFNKGLHNWGPTKTRTIAKLLYDEWHQTSSPDSHPSFPQFAGAVIDGAASIESGSKQMNTFLQGARQEDMEFSTQLSALMAVVEDQISQSARKAAKVQRSGLLWRGSDVNHAQFVALMGQDSQIVDPDVWYRKLMHFEAEHMLRSSEGDCHAPIHIVGISRCKQFGTGYGHQGKVSNVCSIRHSSIVPFITLVICDVVTPDVLQSLCQNIAHVVIQAQHAWDALQCCSASLAYVVVCSTHCSVH